jgi:hypothetical protein
MKIYVRSQLPYIEKGGILDDCGPSSLAAAASWALGGTPEGSPPEARHTAAAAWCCLSRRLPTTAEGDVTGAARRASASAEQKFTLHCDSLMKSRFQCTLALARSRPARAPAGRQPRSGRGSRSARASFCAALLLWRAAPALQQRLLAHIVAAAAPPSQQAPGRE